MWNVLRPVLILVSAIHSSVERVTQPLLADLDTITDTSPLKVTTPSRPCSPSRVDRHRAREGRAHQTLLSVAVAADLRSLPSLLKSPPARPLPTASNSLPEKQEFGPPSNVYYEQPSPLRERDQPSAVRSGAEGDQARQLPSQGLRAPGQKQVARTSLVPSKSRLSSSWIRILSILPSLSSPTPRAASSTSASPPPCPLSPS
ncbi:hypothetical protein C8R47DRAFT_225571 [Mycena vitilis]|nr:hypothetical protein C8R47DRAFT_225571 [Mycena vitilis]